MKRIYLKFPVVLGAMPALARGPGRSGGADRCLSLTPRDSRRENVADSARNWLAWSLMRAGSFQWVEAAVATALAVGFLHRYCGRVQTSEASAAAYVPGVALSNLSLAAAVVLFLFAARFAVHASLPQAAIPMLVFTAAFAAGVALVVGGPRGPLTPRWRLAAAVALLAGVLTAGSGWPTATRAVQGGDFHQEFQFALMGKVINSSAYLAGGLSIYLLIGIALWIGYRLLVKWARARRSGGRSKDEWYPVLLIPLTCWFGLIVVAAAARFGFRLEPHGLARNAFTPPLVPDPVLFSVTGLAAIAPLVLFRRRDDSFRQALLSLAVALPVLAFAPFAVPKALQSNGRLVVIALALPLLFGVTIRASELSKEPGSWRRLSWLVGTSAIVLPLLAYTNAFSQHHVATLTALLSDTGAGKSDVGPLAHLRVVLLLPLLVALAAANRHQGGEGSGDAPMSRVRDFEAAALMQSLHDGDLDETFLDGLREHLAAVPQVEVRVCAADLASRVAGQRFLEMPKASRRAISKAANIARQCALGMPSSVHDLAYARRTASAGRLHRRPLHPAPLLDAPGGTAAATSRSQPPSAAVTACSALRVALGDDEFESVNALVNLCRVEIEDVVCRCDESERADDKERTEAQARKELAGQLQDLPRAFTLFPVVRQVLFFSPSIVLDDPPGPPSTARTAAPAPYPSLLTGLIGFAIFVVLLFALLDLVAPLR